MLLDILIRTFIGYFILLLMLKIMGKREIGQLSLFDLIILLSIADIMIIGIENYEINYWNVFLPILLLTLLQKLIAFIILKSTNLRNIFDGKESIIIFKGKIDLKEMKKLCYNFDDLLAQLRQKDIRSIEEVEYAILENSGKLSVFKYDDNAVFPLPVIVSGKVEKRYLTLLNIDIKWIEKELLKKHLKIKDVNCAFYENNSLRIIS
ncbi:MAG: DUF421 domain-containing protein [Bacilli bacterium]|nr:DUF421 domain-containing protein [Bacilli bacterium]